VFECGSIDSEVTPVPDPIVSSEELDAELERLACAGGSPADFEEAVRDLAGRMKGGLSHRAMVRIARVGSTSYTGPADIPGDELPEFLGRPWDELPRVPRRSDSGGPRRHPLPGEALHEYVGYLGETLFADLGLDDDNVSTPFGRAAAGYLSSLAMPGLREVVGWERSLDAHALGMLTAERGLRHLAEVGMSAEAEEICFRWLHLATYDEVTPAHVEEMRRRRDIRLAHARQPAGAVAVMTCEVSVEDALWFQERMSAGPTVTFGLEQVRTMLDDWAVNAKQPERWAVRREGFGHIGRIGLTAAEASEGTDYGAFVHGHLIRWILEEEVPFRPHLLGLTSGYAASIHRRLVMWPAEGGREVAPVVAHLRAMTFVRQDGFVPLADELVLLAWLMDQRCFGVRLAPYLDARDKHLAADPGE